MINNKFIKHALDLITVETLESLTYGDEKRINHYCELYHYCEEDIIVLNYKGKEIYQFLYDLDSNIITLETL